MTICPTAKIVKVGSKSIIFCPSGKIWPNPVALDTKDVKLEPYLCVSNPDSIVQTKEH